MVHGKKRIPYWRDRRLNGLAEPEYDVAISLGLPCEPEDSQYGEYRLNHRATYLPGIINSLISENYPQELHLFLPSRAKPQNEHVLSPKTVPNNTLYRPNRSHESNTIPP